MAREACAAHPPTSREPTPVRGVALVLGGQNPITLEYQIYPPPIDTLVTGMHHIDGAGLQSPFIGAENRTVPFIGRDFHHQQCSSPGTPRGKEQENRPPPPQQRTGYPLHNSPAASLIPKPGNHLTVKPTPSNNCCRTNRNMRAGMGPENM